MARKSASESSLRWRKDGTPIVSSESHVAVAEALIRKNKDEIEKRARLHGIVAMFEENDKLAAEISAFVIKRYDASEGYEDDSVKLTKVVGHMRSWNPAKLEKLLPRVLYRKVINVTVNTQALDQLVRDGKIDRKKIEKAYEEVEKAPYVKRTDKTGTKDTAKAENEAAALLAKLGG